MGTANKSQRQKDDGDKGNLKSGTMKKKESRVPAYLEPLVILDKKASSWLAVCASHSSTFGNLRKHMKLLEISCHGIPWLAASVGALLVFTNIEIQEVFLNILIALLLDCLFVAVIKAAARRGRPQENVDDMFATISLDGYAFPSGHASRAVLLFMITLFKTNFSILALVLIAGWSFMVCMSRILMARHHVGDVIAGWLLGFFEYHLINSLWVGQEGTRYMLTYFEILGDE